MARRLGISIVGNTLRDKIDLTKRAEEAGFEMVFTSDDPGQETFVSLAAMACNSSTVKIGSGICRAFIRNPVVTAGASANVDELSNGRMILGLASGTKRQNLYQYGVQVEKPAAQLREAIAIMRRIWDLPAGGGGFAHKGDFYDIPRLRFGAPVKARETVPIYIAAVNAGMARMAGELCEGMAGHPCYTGRFIKGFIEPNVKIGLDRAGRDRSSFDMGRWITTVVDDDAEKARYDVKMGLGNYLATRSYGSLLDFHGWTPEKEAIQDAFFNKKDMNAVANAVSDQILSEMGIAGTPDQAREQLLEQWDTCDIPVLIPTGFGLTRTQHYERTRKLIETFAPLLK